MNRVWVQKNASKFILSMCRLSWDSIAEDEHMGEKYEYMQLLCNI